MLRFLRSALRKVFVLPILFYQKVISPHLPGSCIYYPTCSHYAKEAVFKHGIIKGFILGITRIFRCIGGVFTGGEDPVPEDFTFSYIGSAYKLFFNSRKKRD